MKRSAQTALLIASQTSFSGCCFNTAELLQRHLPSVLHGASFRYSMPFVVSVKKPLTRFCFHIYHDKDLAADELHH